MHNRASSKTYQSTLNAHKAMTRSVETLINCYCREFALSRKEVSFVILNQGQDCPESFKLNLTQQPSNILYLTFPALNASMMIKVSDIKAMGQCRHRSSPYLKSVGNGWKKLTQNELTIFLLNYLSLTTRTPFNFELYTQIKNSIDNMQLFLNNVIENSPQIRNNGFIQSEQSMLWGHAWHPSAKSREGVCEKTLVAISPETGASFQLYYLAVRDKLVKSCVDTNVSINQVLKQTTVDVPKGYTCIPCHPYQIEVFKESQLFQQAILANDIIMIEPQGDYWCPTSSVRTLYNSNANYFLKFSLHVRLTNCVRKNAWYELETAVFLTSLMRRINDGEFNNFNIMLEPASITLDLSSIATLEQQNDALSLSEAFGILFRDSLNHHVVDKWQPRVASAIFSDDENFCTNTTSYIDALVKYQVLNKQKAVIEWFDHYVSSLLPPVLYYFFKQGVIFEPHLQNVLIGFNQHLPNAIWLRDLEGTKLVDCQWQNQVNDQLSEKSKTSIFYDRAKGWQRVAYCLLINNISEAIFHLSGDCQKLEAQMWQVVRTCLIDYQKKYGTEPELTGLLSGASIPCKCNLMTRLMKHADKQSSYVYLDNPMVISHGK